MRLTTATTHKYLDDVNVLIIVSFLHRLLIMTSLEQQQQSGWSTAPPPVPRVVSGAQDLDDHPDLVLVPSSFRTVPAPFPATAGGGGEADSVHSSLSDVDLRHQPHCSRPAVPRWYFPTSTTISNGKSRMDSASSSGGSRSFRAAADWGWFDDGHASNGEQHEVALPGQFLSWSLPIPTTHWAGRSDTPALRHWWLAQQQQKKEVEPAPSENPGK
jgi:hypothetical protein